VLRASTLEHPACLDSKIGRIGIRLSAMRRSELAMRALRRVALPAIGLAALISAAPAPAAFPGVPGPIAYSYFTISEFEDTGGIFAHGPRKRDASLQLTEDRDDSSPSYSPDGRLIVFSSNRDPGETQGSHIYLMKSDGSGIRQLTSGGFYDSNPSFSPSGNLVVFDRGGLQGRATHIFSVATDGSGLRQIGDDAGSDSDPTFTPNGKRIVFVSNRRSSGRRDRGNIFSMRPDGSRVRLLIGGPREEYDPDVSPNGRKVAFASNRDHGHGPNLFVARIDGTHVRELTHSRHDCFESACYASPSWAPDGKHIAFLSIGRYSSEVAVMRADGRGFSRDFAGGGTEEEGLGDRVGAPGWGPRPR
jgi:Tol biopolymer transport system component